MSTRHPERYRRRRVLSLLQQASYWWEQVEMLTQLARDPQRTTPREAMVVGRKAVRYGKLAHAITVQAWKEAAA